jgi:hypothetical protein
VLPLRNQLCKTKLASAKTANKDDGSVGPVGISVFTEGRVAETNARKKRRPTALPKVVSTPLELDRSKGRLNSQDRRELVS